VNSPIRIWRNHKKVINRLNLHGVVLAWTKIFAAPSGFEKQTPYFVAIIKLETGEKITAMVVDCGELQTGDKVKTVLRRLQEVARDEVIEYGIKCVKIEKD
jgi:uncharacterized OB-fold protein